MNPRLTIFNNGAVSSATAAGTAIWIFTNVCFLGLTNAIAKATDKQYYNNTSLMAAAQETGLNGTLNAAEVTAIFYLLYPQQYRSIIARFGMPYSRDEWRDFYRVEGGRNWIAIEYRGTTAVGFIIISQD